ncbi:B3 domain-containing transcription factor ABI3-like [Primulina tabacum]|uniref:B3 domain-containing transcription factor ABI3-like n=1 Tax=Primulina tabacum TaxID=48773 RepID=UPI003F5A3F78
MLKNEYDPTGEQDFHASAGNVDVKIEIMEAGNLDIANPSCGFEAMEEDHHQGVVMESTVGEKDLWLDRDEENFLDVNEASVFYSDFPPLPDFPCMSSSSSSSTAPPGVNPIGATSSSSSHASSSPTSEEDTGQRNFQQIKGGDQVKAEPSALSATASMEITPPPEYVGVGNVDCIDVMETLGYMDLLDSNDIWDPSSVFQSEIPQEFTEDQQAAAMEAEPPPQQDQKMLSEEENDDGFSFIQGNSELAMIFFQWLKQNKDYISAEDMRNIKLKRSTIESASKRLGSTKEGKKQLLKLILEWVEQFHLQKNGTRERARQSTFPSQETAQNPEFIPNSCSHSNMNYNPAYLHPTTCFPTMPWLPPQFAGAATMVAHPLAFPPPMEGYSAGDPYTNYIHAAPLNYQLANGIPYPASAEYSSMEHARSWAPMAPFTMPPPSQFSPFPGNGNLFPQPHNLYGNPYLFFDKNGERLVKLGSLATKEARKKRMARQRSLYSYHNRRSSNPNQNNDQINDQHVVADDCENGSPDCLHWSSVASSDNSTMVATVPPVDVSQQPNYMRQCASDRRQQQGWKTEKNLKFLLQKVLKQSDVGNLGRIVLPKKEAESHLPELDSRDGIPISMEDIGTSRVWNMRYRFWPNNKSRMYLLENTGEFVRINGLQEGDFIVIYSDMKCGKYMIRGVKVRQPGTKLEGGKKPATRKNPRSLSISRTSASLAPIKQSV